ncbi:hypothetical protein BDF20DRAFT_857295 [Mycotypha africana]|uniref:uncharacterized protein n=1 Tax=Mycotypha africana TaxID=64632 RepID=UPI0023012774|nr:uncharacterized protein BDF20DRAFT_857295 [Mycotypha africana]KAI8983979.1 hypothetical protein BDF20DRAFT_857295 [Mycotypha africana]
MFKVNDYQTATLTPTKLLLSDPLTSSNWNFNQATMADFMDEAVGSHPLDTTNFNKYNLNRTPRPELALPPSPPSPTHSPLPTESMTTRTAPNPLLTHLSDATAPTANTAATATSPKSNTSTASSNTSIPSTATAKQQRKRLLEKNREAASRCRQKKKRWVNGLEERSQIAQAKNEELQGQIKQLREESIYLRNLLLTHGNCNCEVVQTYLRRTSEQLSNKVSLSSSSAAALIGSSISNSNSSGSGGGSIRGRKGSTHHHSSSLIVGFGDTSSVTSSENGTSNLFNNGRATPPYDYQHYQHDMMTQHPLY